MMDLTFPAFSLLCGMALGSVLAMATSHCQRSAERNRRVPAWDSASLEACAQSEQVCNAVAQRLGVVVTIPPWQAMVLTPVLDPR